MLVLRCGGIADESNEDEGGDVEGNIDGSPQQPLVDVSVIESEDSSANDDIEGSQAEADPETSENGSESDLTHAQEDDAVDDDSNEKNDSDLTESSTKQEELASPEDVLSDTDEESGVEDSESSDTDISDSPTAIPDTELVEKQSQLRSSASERRAEGKNLHDAGSLSDAAQAFHEAASLLDEAIAVFEFSVEDESIAVERATCRLHEALCLFKDGRPGDCVEACTDVLEDGVTVVPLEGEDNDAGANKDGESQPPTMTVIKVTPPAAVANSAIPPQIRARAHHRRAKARLALGDLDGALEDARSAAFMGDRNAVQFYGRLMREGSGAATGESSNTGGFGGLPFGLSEGSGGGGSSNSFMEGLLEGMTGSGNNPLMPSGAGSSDFSSSLLSSLLSSGSDSGGGGNPLGLLGDLFSPPPPEIKGKSKHSRRGGKKKKAGGMDGLAKSVLTSLMKRIEDEETQETICNYLHSTNTQQIIQFSTMAGIPIQEKSAQRLVTMAGGVTPKGISKSISKVKRGISIVKTVRKVLKVIDKYKAVIILAFLCYWIRSAIVEPYPISKKQAKKLAQKAAFSLMIAPSCQSSRRSVGNLCGGMVKALSNLYLSGSENNEEGNDGIAKTGIEGELEGLQNQLSLIEALEVML